ncbi:serine-type endopeptidase inhibitor activity protein [Homalodisca vitripennis]|nr:serine-type endopeptidase inhibitor activity protein [Homalodisca vitripennis]
MPTHCSALNVTIHNHGLQELNAVEHGHGNIVISPISLKVVLAMLYEGARGTTAQQIGDALDLVNTTVARRRNTRDRFSAILTSLQTSEGEYKIKIGTHVFLDKNAEAKNLYLCKLRRYYNSALEKVDFSDTAAAISAINNWASNVTEGHIQHLVSEEQSLIMSTLDKSLDLELGSIAIRNDEGCIIRKKQCVDLLTAEAHSNTVMLLLNAVYFNGLWEIPFPDNQTATGPFYINNTHTVDVELMNTTDKFKYYDITELDAQLIRLPYLGKKFAMYILLPNNKTGLDALINNLGPERPLTDYISNMTMTSINLIMPKFEFDFTTSLRPILEKIGLVDMFTSAADLSDIAETKSGSLVVSNVLQKAGISVTEIGTEAYAASAVELMDKFGGEEEPIEIRADHPFMFFIEEERIKTTVFVGKVINPEKTKVVDDKLNVPTGDTTPPAECSGA